ncbi:MAG: hypothetical protein ACPGQS_01895, partial [Bradymonadia bacterium]
MKTQLFPVVLLIIGCATSPGSSDMMTPDASEPDGTLPVDALQAESDVHLDDQGAPDVSRVDAEILECDTLTQCGQNCVETQSDPSHCGGCGRTCFFPNAEANCVNGQCQLGNCEVGFFNTDADDSNGCELADECIEGQLCVTSCDSEGSTVCESGLQECLPPAEVCNAQDDNCDDLCDEGGISGCRVSVARSFGSSGHAYHRDRRFLTDRGFNIESAEYFYVYTSPFRGMRPMFLCPKNNGKFFLASGTACEPVMRSPVAEIGFWSPQPLCGSIPLFSLYKADQDNHFYTTSPGERESVLANLGYEDRGIA